MEQETLKSIDNKLGVIIRLLAGNFVLGKSKTDAIITLASFGIDTNAIAEIVGTTPATVNARLWEQKKKSGATRKKAEVAQE